MPEPDCEEVEDGNGVPDDSGAYFRPATSDRTKQGASCSLVETTMAHCEKSAPSNDLANSKIRTESTDSTVVGDTISRQPVLGAYAACFPFCQSSMCDFDQGASVQTVQIVSPAPALSGVSPFDMPPTFIKSSHTVLDPESKESKHKCIKKVIPAEFESAASGEAWSEDDTSGTYFRPPTSNRIEQGASCAVPKIISAVSEKFAPDDCPKSYAKGTPVIPVASEELACNEGLDDDSAKSLEGLQRFLQTTDVHGALQTEKAKRAPVGFFNSRVGTSSVAVIDEKEVARQALNAAIRAGDPATLPSAIVAAKEAGFTEEELVQANHILEQARSIHEMIDNLDPDSYSLSSWGSSSTCPPSNPASAPPVRHYAGVTHESPTKEAFKIVHQGKAKKTGIPKSGTRLVSAVIERPTRIRAISAWMAHSERIEMEFLPDSARSNVL